MFLERMIFFGESSLRRAVAEYVEHDHAERAHQGLGNERIAKPDTRASGNIQCRERLGGILKHDYRAAWMSGASATRLGFRTGQRHVGGTFPCAAPPLNDD